MKKSLLLLIAALCVIAGCGHRPHADTETTAAATVQTTSLTAAQVLAIARQAVATNDTWLDRAEFETPRRQPDGSWSVLVWRLPKSPGGHRFININDKGQVTSYFRGR
jgi:PBP1b-binding outer membrane lipoprotein LpoB